MLIIIQHVLNTADYRHMLLTPQVHDILNLWQNFVTSFSSQIKSLREIITHPPTWKGVK